MTGRVSTSVLSALLPGEREASLWAERLKRRPTSGHARRGQEPS